MSSHVSLAVRPAFALLLVALAASGCGSTPDREPAARTNDAAAGSTPAPSSAPVALDADGFPAFTDVPEYKATATRTGAMAGPGPEREAVHAWRTNLGCAVADRTPIVSGGLLIVGCDRPTLTALDARTGAIAWTAPLGGPAYGSALSDGTTVYVADAGGSMHALDLRTGTPRWTASVPASRHPTLVDGSVYVGTTDGRVVGLDPADGTVSWTWKAPANDVELIATLAGDTLYAGASDGTFYAVDRASGTVRWTFTAPSGRVSTPAVGETLVYVSGLQVVDGVVGGLFALDPATGEERWRATSAAGSQLAPPTLLGDTVYAPSRDNGLYALDAATGAERWRADVGGHMSGQPPALTAGTVYAAADRSVGAYDTATGARRWFVDLEADVDNGVVVSGGMVFSGDNAGNITALAERTLASAVAAIATPSATAAPSPSPTTEPVLAVGGELTKAAADLDQPSGMDIGPDGLLYVISGIRGQVQVIDPATGATVRRIGEAGSGDGQLTFLREAGDPMSAIGGVAVGDDGTVFVTDTVNRRIQVFDPEGRYLRQWGRFGSDPGEFLDPIDIALAPNGDVYVVDDQRDDIQRFTPEGKLVATIGRHGSGDGELMFTGGIATDENGVLYNADWDNSRVQAWDDEGTFLWTLGSRGSDPGEFSTPRDVAVDDMGRLIVTDPTLRRIQVFGPDRELLSVVPLPDLEPNGTAIEADRLYVSVQNPEAILVLDLEP
jgi:outer membrane protein assembly factor BamB